MSHEPRVLDIAELKKGDHSCGIYKTKDEQFSVLVPYFKIGLAKKEKCIYVFHDTPQPELISEFKKRGFEDIETFLASGEFSFVSAKAFYSPDGTFDPHRIVDAIETLNAALVEQPFSGIRGAAEMSWILDDKENQKKMRVYESKLNQCFPSWKITTICQYDETKFSSDFLCEIIHTHRYIFFNGKLYNNKYFYNPSLFFSGDGKKFPSGSYSILKESILEAE